MGITINFIINCIMFKSYGVIKMTRKMKMKKPYDLRSLRQV